MKSFFLLLFLFTLFIPFAHAQDSLSNTLQLEYINNFNIKMDGGCAYYSYDTENVKLDLHNDAPVILAIVLNDIAMIKIKGENYNTFLKCVSKSPYEGKVDTSAYSGERYYIKLNTYKIENKTGRALYQGLATIRYGKKDTTIRIKGILVK